MGIQADTTSGPITGRRRDDVLLFAGVPYAAAPIADLRFQPPRRHGGWTEVRSATNFGPAAPQQGGMMAMLAGGEEADWQEDCLYLNVQTPATDDGQRPVMVWIHGGGFTGGTGGIPWYNGTNFVRHGDVVVVTINYRLGALGFLHLAHLTDDYAGSGNNGIADQIRALEWVRDNIAAFGGDPDNVTIFGESAGAMSVGTLLGTPAAAGLFHRAIAQSGAAHNVAPADSAAEVADRLLHHLEITGGGSSGVQELARLDPARLLDAQDSVADDVNRSRLTRRSGSGLGLPFGPVIDEVVLPQPPIDEVRDGRSSHIPLLIGTTRNEWNLFALMGATEIDDDTIARRAGRIFPDPQAALDTYRSARRGAGNDAVWSAIVTDQAFRIPAVRLAEAQHGHQPTKTFMYRFDWASTAFDGRLAACHALEIPFVWDNLHQPGIDMFTGGDAPQQIADNMHAAWIAFARSGDPNHLELPAWVPYDEADRPVLAFDETSRVITDPDAAERRLWADLI